MKWYESYGNEGIGRWLLRFRIVRWIAKLLGWLPVREIKDLNIDHVSLMPDGSMKIGGTIGSGEKGRRI